MNRSAIALGLAGLVLSACSDPAPVGVVPSIPASVAPASVAPAPSAPAPSAPAPSAPAPAESPAAVFTGTISAVTPQQVPFSWRPGCPIPVENLRLLTVSYRDRSGISRTGRMVVNRDQADGVLNVMRTLFEQQFPIEMMEPMDAYRGDDNLSMAANNSSGFNCRSVTGRPGVWSVHSYGRAIDINPVQNPFVTNTGVVPPSGAGFQDRSRKEPGMIHAGDGVVKAFQSIGWSWGGTWKSSRDYQHFSSTGR